MLKALNNSFLLDYKTSDMISWSRMRSTLGNILDKLIREDKKERQKWIICRTIKYNKEAVFDKIEAMN